MPIVVVDIPFHLVASRRRAPEKIRRKPVAHAYRPQTHGLDSPICTVCLGKHSVTVWILGPHMGVRLDRTIYSSRMVSMTRDDVRRYCGGLIWLLADSHMMGRLPAQRQLAQLAQRSAVRVYAPQRARALRSARRPAASSRDAGVRRSA